MNEYILPPVLLLGDVDDGLELFLANLGSLSSLTLFKSLTNAQDDPQACIDCGAGLLGNEGGSFVEQSATLGVT